MLGSGGRAPVCVQVWVHVFGSGGRALVCVRVWDHVWAMLMQYIKY